MSRRTYRNPPIQEALCEFRFAGGASWNVTLQARFVQEFQQEFGGRVEEQTVYAAALLLGHAPPGLVTGPKAQQLRFIPDDENAPVIVGENTLSVHALAPYPGWDAFRPRIERALEVYLRIAQPSGITRIGVRYINRFEVPTASRPSEFLGDAPDTAGSLRAHTHRDEHQLDQNDLLIVMSASALEGDRRALVLDLDLIHEWPDPAEAGLSAMGTVDRLHEREGVEFERQITDTARGVFDGDA